MIKITFYQSSENGAVGSASYCLSRMPGLPFAFWKLFLLIWILIHYYIFVFTELSKESFLLLEQYHFPSRNMN